MVFGGVFCDGGLGVLRGFVGGGGGRSGALEIRFGADAVLRDGMHIRVFALAKIQPQGLYGFMPAAFRLFDIDFNSDSI